MHAGRVAYTSSVGFSDGAGAMSVQATTAGEAVVLESVQVGPLVQLGSLVQLALLARAPRAVETLSRPSWRARTRRRGSWARAG